MKEKIDKFKSVVSRKYVVLMTDLFISSYSRTDLYKKVYFGDYYVSSAYTNGIFYYRQNAWDFGYALLERENRESFYLDKVFSNIYEVGDNLLKLSKKINQKKYYNVSWENLKNDFDFFVELYQEFALSLLGYNMQHPIEDFLRDLLERENDLEEKLSIISFPKKENIYVKEQKSLLRLGLKIDKTKKIYSAQSTSVKNEIKRHLRNYAWIYYRGGEGKILGEVDIFKQVLAIGPDYKKKINHLLYSKNKSEKKFNELCLQLKLNKK
ncbi:hypothetical protein K9M09_02745, partial [Patescibacteria group bacterium]|nr:hypothetical protein [Patescibacteria group bacterium]